jgi:hypothetical protein
MKPIHEPIHVKKTTETHALPQNMSKLTIKLAKQIKSKVVIDDEFRVVALTYRSALVTLRNVLRKHGRKIEAAWYHRWTDGQHCCVTLLIKY